MNYFIAENQYQNKENTTNQQVSRRRDNLLKDINVRYLRELLARKDTIWRHVRKFIQDFSKDEQVGDRTGILYKIHHQLCRSRDQHGLTLEQLTNAICSTIKQECEVEDFFSSDSDSDSETEPNQINEPLNGSQIDENQSVE